MATSEQFTITTTSQVIVSVDDVPQRVYLHAAKKTFLGNEGVTSSNGYLLDVGDKIAIEVYAGEVIWAVTDAGSGTLYALKMAQK